MVVDKLGREGMLLALDLQATPLLLSCVLAAFAPASASTTYGSTDAEPTE